MNSIVINEPRVVESSIYAYKYLILQSKVIAITLFVCLSVCLSVCFLCVRNVDIYTHAWKNTWNTTRNIMMLYHEVFMYL